MLLSGNLRLEITYYLEYLFFNVKDQLMKNFIRFGALALFFACLFQSCSKEELPVVDEDLVEAKRFQSVLAVPIGGPSFSIDIESDYLTLWNYDADDLKDAGLSICLSTACGFGSPEVIECFDIDFGTTLLAEPGFSALKFQSLSISNMSWSYNGGPIADWGYWECVGDPIRATITDECGCYLGSVDVPGPSASDPWQTNFTIDVDLQEIVDYMNSGSCISGC